MPIKEALELAREANLDLVEVAAQSAPPVCKIIDYGKYKYQLQKKNQEAKKNQKTVVVKELQLTLHIAEHDYNVKLNAAKKFLEHRYKVKVTLRLRGRQMMLKKEAVEFMQGFYAAIGGEDFVKLDSAPKVEGNRVNMMVARA